MNFIQIKKDCMPFQHALLTLSSLKFEKTKLSRKRKIPRLSLESVSMSVLNFILCTFRINIKCKELYSDLGTKIAKNVSNSMRTNRLSMKFFKNFKKQVGLYKKQQRNKTFQHHSFEENVYI